jgi:glycerophosphoryl diester phosphodiesterase
VERIAHRGAKRELPENTIAAFERAFERGADAIELDVHATRDRVIVVHHDPSFHLAGKLLPNRIAELDWNMLQHAGSGTRIGVPALADVLESTPQDKTIYVEIKGRGIEPLVADVIRADRRCAVHSFDHAAIAMMRSLLPDTPRGVLVERASEDIVAIMKATSARDVWPERKLVSQALVELVHDLGGRVIPWTVNSPETIAAFRKLGVDGACTDDVRLFG